MSYYRIEISVADANDQVLEATLNNEKWFIRMLWNETGQYWSMSINDYKNEALLYNLKITANYQIGAAYFSNDKLPQGGFIVETNREDKVLRNDFKDKIATLYFYYKTTD